MLKSNRDGPIRKVFKPGPRFISRLLVAIVVVVITVSSAAADETTAKDQHTESAAASDSKPEFNTEWIRGKVAWTAAALQREFGISTVPEVAENSLAILTKDGQLLPIVENLRGRAFRKDERLREMEVEILARRYQRQPLIQILRLYQVEGDRRYEIDYWCDVCAIVMYETGPCACCQDANRLRKRPVQQQDLPSKAVESATR
jgi:hypothetical protein